MGVLEVNSGRSFQVESYLQELQEAIDYYPRLRRLREYVEKNLKDEISLENAARQAGLERTYFSAYFHKTIGVRFHTWLRLVRIHEALQILRSTDHSISELAADVGYQDLTTFERAFRRTTGCTPSSVRKAFAPESSQQLPITRQFSPRHHRLRSPKLARERGTNAPGKGQNMARQEDDKRLHVRGSIDVDKFKAARALGGSDVKFELRAMRPVKAGEARSSCIVCFVCFVCIVCIAAKAQRLGIPDLRSLEGAGA